MKKNITEFESLSLNDSEKLVGGFSVIYSTPFSEEEEKKDDITNSNCNGGNCKAGCNNKGEEGESSEPIPNGNCGAGKNCIAGCGEKA